MKMRMKRMEMMKKSSGDRSTSYAVHLLYILGLLERDLLQPQNKFGTLATETTHVQT